MSSKTVVTTRENDVSIPSPTYLEMANEWRMIKALLGGTKAMRLEREEYLPKFQGEDDKAYNFRLKQSYLYNYFKKAVQALVGKPFSKPLIQPDNIPAEIQPIVDDFDMQGNDITMYAKKWFECGMSFGLSYTLIDYPNTGGVVLSKAQEKAQNIRPYAVHVPADCIIGWRSISVDGVHKLQQVRIRQETQTPDGLFGETSKTIIRVYDWFPDAAPGLRVKWSVFEDKGSALGWVVTSFGFLSAQDEIPLVCLYTGQKGFMIAEPPLLDLAYLNVAHWQSTSDYRHIMHIQAVPILFAQGWGKDEMPSTAQVGPNRMMVGVNPDSKLSYVEHSGVAIGKLEGYIDKLEDQMAAMAVKLMAESRPGGVTATEVSIDTAAAESALKSMTVTLDDALETVLYYMMKWLAIATSDKATPEFKTNKDFGLMTGNDMIANWLLKANAQGIITKQTVGEGAKKVGYLDEDLDMDKELELAGEESMKALEAMNSVLDPKPADGTPPAGGDKPASGSGDPAAGNGGEA